jgi:hypothetical protein
MAISFTPGKVENTYNLKSGAGEVFFRPVMTAPTFTAINDTAQNDITASDTAWTGDVGLSTYTDGDVLYVKRTDEVIFVVDATGGVPVTVLRGVDGTTAQDIPSGAAIVKIGYGFQINNAAGEPISSTDLTVDIVPGDANYDVDDEYVLRRGKDTGSRERIYLLDETGGTSLEVKRNMTLRDDTLTIADIADDEILFVSRAGYYDPDAEEFRSRRWKQLEVKDNITITTAMEVTQTDSTQRIGDNSLLHSRYQVSMGNVITDPELVGQLCPNLDVTINDTYATNNYDGTNSYNMQEDKGFGLNTHYGEEAEGIMIYVKGKESTNNRQIQFIAYKAAINSVGDLVIGPDQRMQDLTFDCIHAYCMDSPGVLKNSLNLPSC